MSWTIARVGDLCEQIRGVTYAKGDASRSPLEDTIALLRAGNISSQGLRLDDLVHVPRDKVREKQILRNGDVLIAASSGSIDVVGKAAAFYGEKSKITFGAFCKVLRPGSKVDAKYFSHYFQTAKYREKISWLAAGANINNIRNEDLDNLEIPLPPLPEQRRIAAILDHADALRSRRRTSALELDKLHSSYMDRLLKGRGDVHPLSEVYWFQEGPGIRKWQFTESGVKLLNVGNILKNGTIDLDRTDRHVSNEEAYGRYKHFLIDSGDLVIASSGVGFDVDGLLSTRGAFISHAHLPLCMNTSTIRFKPLGDASLEFLQQWLKSYEFRSQITRLVTGTAQQNFGPSHLKKLKITVPSLADMVEFTKAARAMDSHRNRVSRAASRLDELFNTLQARAFLGEL